MNTREEILNELDVRLPQLRYALKFNDPEFGLKHLNHLEKMLRENKIKDIVTGD